MEPIVNYSLENQLKTQIVLGFLISSLELKDPNNDFALKIPISLFNNKGITYVEIFGLLRVISESNLLFEVLNEKYTRLLRESIRLDSVINSKKWDQKNQELKDAYYILGFTEEDVKEYILIQIKESTALSKLKTVQSELNNKLGLRGKEVQKSRTEEEDALLSTIPKGGKNRVTRRITKKFMNKSKVDNWILMSCITPTIGNRRFLKKDYSFSRDNSKIKSTSITLKKYWKKANFTIKCSKEFSEKIPL